MKYLIGLILLIFISHLAFGKNPQLESLKTAQRWSDFFVLKLDQDTKIIFANGELKNSSSRLPVKEGCEIWFMNYSFSGKVGHLVIAYEMNCNSGPGYSVVAKYEVVGPILKTLWLQEVPVINLDMAGSYDYYIFVTGKGTIAFFDHKYGKIEFMDTRLFNKFNAYAFEYVEDLEPGYLRFKYNETATPEPAGFLCLDLEKKKLTGCE